MKVSLLFNGGVYALPDAHEGYSKETLEEYLGSQLEGKPKVVEITLASGKKLTTRSDNIGFLYG